MTDLRRPAPRVDPGLLELAPVPERPAPLVPAWCRRLADGAEQLVFEAPLAVFLAVVAVLDVVKNGAAGDANLRVWLRIATAFPDNPHLPASVRYQEGSPVGPALAHLLGIRTTGAYAGLHVAVLVVALAVLVVGLHRRGGRVAVGVGVVAFLATPLSNVLLSFGSQDPFTFLFASLAVLADGPALSMLAGVGLGVSHLEVGVFVVVSVAAVRTLSPEPTGRAGLVALAAGLVAGAAATVAYEHHAGAGAGARAGFIEQTGLRTLAADFTAELPTWLFSTFSAFWVFAAVAVSALWRRRAVQAAVLLALAAVAVTVVTLDETRVYALLTWPLVLWLGLEATRRLDTGLVRRLTAVTFLVAVVVPRIVVFEGHPSVSYAAGAVTRFFAHL